MLEFFSQGKKGISPLIAAVLLIAFTMTVAAILATWAQSFGEERLGEAGERGTQAVECPELNLDIESAEWDETDSKVKNAIVWNRMGKNVSEIQFIVYEDGTPTSLDAVATNDDSISISPGSFQELESEADGLNTEPTRLEIHVDSERCPDVQPIDWCEGYDNGQFNC